MKNIKVMLFVLLLRRKKLQKLAVALNVIKREL